jgi:hypothetical protein
MKRMERRRFDVTLEVIDPDKGEKGPPPFSARTMEQWESAIDELSARPVAAEACTAADCVGAARFLEKIWRNLTDTEVECYLRCVWRYDRSTREWVQMCGGWCRPTPPEVH